MRHADVNRTLVKAFAAGWTASGRSERIYWPNEAAAPGHGVAFGRFSVAPNLTTRGVFTGSPSDGERYLGIAFFQAFAPAGAGDALAWAMAEAGAAILHEKRFAVDGGGSLVTFSASAVPASGASSDAAGLFLINVSAEYEFLNA